jgi:hypothetical protein
MIAEHIPDQDTLFRRVHKNLISPSEDNPTPNIFDCKEDISVNWQRYCNTSKDARNKAINPKNNGVVSIICGNARNHGKSSVEHTPSDSDHSHSSIFPKE